MFRIECFVDDKMLADALRALTGKVRGQPNVTPVVNAEVTKNGKIEAASDGSMLSMFTAFLQKNGHETVIPKQAQDWLESMGRSKLSSTYLLTQAVKAKVLRRRGTGSASTYIVRK
jgi:hypothetical protein